jgi:Methyltransferase domain/Glycosyl transferase family 2
MIFGVMLVRNEADIIRANLAYHLASGIDQILVVDNGSTDGTTAILEEFAASRRVHVSSRPGAFLQAATTTELAREAFLRGAEWVVPIDADEFWHVPNGCLRDVLDDAAGAGALEVEVVNFVQQRSQDGLAPEALLTMTRRVPEPVGASGEANVLVESGRIGFVEIRYPPKYVSRGSIAVQIAQGNHSVSGTGGPARPTTAIRCLHAPLRARAALERQKVESGRPVHEVSDYLRHTWQLRRWRRLAAQGKLEAEWAANSYLDECLDVYGDKHPVVVDATLRDILAPWIEAAADRSRQASPARPAARARGQGLAHLDPATTAAILDGMERVEGWLRREEAELLLRFTRRAVTGHDTPAVVEIGSFCGKSTIVLASAVKTANPAARVYAIDPHDGEVGAHDTLEGVRSESPTFERFQTNVAAAGLAGLIHAIRQRSHEVSWDRPIAFLFVDGLHDYANVARDFHHFEPYLREGAYVAFHDCDDNYPGVRAFVIGLAGGVSYEEVGRSASLVVFRKTAISTPAGAGETEALRVRLRQQEKGISFLMGEIAERERIIRAREEGIEWLRGVVRDKEMSIAELEKGVEWLRKEVREQNALIETLRAAAETRRSDPKSS